MRSNSELQQAIQDALATMPGVSAGQVDVRVTDGVVTLGGIMRSDAEKWSLEDAVRLIPGVEGLVNETMVVAGTSDAQPGADIARQWFP